jgi:hypothetical protein
MNVRFALMTMTYLLAVRAMLLRGNPDDYFATQKVPPRPNATENATIVFERPEL